MLKYSEGMISLKSDISVFHHIWEADDPNGYIVIVYGFGGKYSGQYKTMAEYMTPRGVTLLAYDLRGHGKRQMEKREVRF